MKPKTDSLIRCSVCFVHQEPSSFIFMDNQKVCYDCVKICVNTVRSNDLFRFYKANLDITMRTLRELAHYKHLPMEKMTTSMKKMCQDLDILTYHLQILGKKENSDNYNALIDTIKEVRVLTNLYQ